MNVVVLLYDTLRLDYFKRRMPRTRALFRRQGWHTFENHWSVAHCSDPNISTILASDPPWITNITTQMGKDFKSISPFLLQNLFAKHGYFTWAIQPSANVPRFYTTSFEQLAHHKATHVADLELGALKAFMSETGDRPFFGFVRDMTCHYPYGSKVELPPRGNGGKIVPLYREAVKHIDAHAELFITTLLERFPDTVVVVVSDHGEMLGEKGRWDHLWRLDNTLIHVPLVIYVPDTEGGTYTFPTQHVDLWPTIMDLVHFTIVKEVAGVSLAGVLRGSAPPEFATRLRERRLWLQGIGAGPVEEFEKVAGKRVPRIDDGSNRFLWRHRGVILGDIKIVENTHPDAGSEFEAFKITDYLEKRSLVREIVSSVVRLLPPIPDYPAMLLPAVGILSRRQQEAVILNRLKALGYA